MWEWANDPDTRAWSFSQQPIPWEAHVAWLQQRLRNPATSLYVAATEAGDPVGQVRFDRREDGDAEISVTLDPAWRGRGYASVALRAACARYLETATGRIVAYVKPDNEPSLRAFAGAGFERVGTATVRGEPVVELILDGRHES